MKIKEYIIKKLNELIENFPFLKASYFVDDFSKSNYIKILPLNEFEGNKEYKEFEIKMIIDFINQYPYDEIVFVSEKNILELSNLVYEIEGKLFTDKHTYNTDIWKNNFNFDFDLSFNKSVIDIINNYHSLKEVIEKFNEEIFINPIIVEPVEIIEEEAGEISYALAA